MQLPVYRPWSVNRDGMGAGADRISRILIDRIETKLIINRCRQR